MNLRKRTAELLEQGQSADKPSRIINLSLILLITMNVVAIILESVSSIYQQYERQFWYFEVFSVAVFTIEYLLRVWSSIDLDEIDDASPIRGRIRYMLSPIALIGEADGERLELKDVDRVAARLRQALLDVQEGRAGDPHGWMVGAADELALGDALNRRSLIEDNP